MRYIYAVAGIILIILGLSGITFLRSQPPSSKELARINERAITIDEFRKAYDEKHASSPVPIDKRLFVDELITKEILIQEAKRRGLDLREPFRRSIQNYYEQTLLKNLAQARMSEIKVSIDEKEITSYYENMGKVFRFKVMSFAKEAEAFDAVKSFPSAEAGEKTLSVAELPDEMINDISALKSGDVYQRPVPFNRVFLVFKLEGIRNEPVPPLSEVRDEIRRTLEEKKRRAEMEMWLAELKKNANIKLNEELLRQGE